MPEDTNGIMIVWDELKQLSMENPRDFITAVDCLESSMDAWWELSKPMYLLLRDDPPSSLTSILPIINKPYRYA
jgi:hypothetical protein